MTMDVTQDLGRQGPRPLHEERYERIPQHEIELIKFRDSHTTLLFKLVNGDTLEGAIRWYDDQAIRLVQSDRSEITLFRRAIAFYQSQPR
jgi:sRNA-binding regulator protein Hfq